MVFKWKHIDIYLVALLFATSPRVTEDGSDGGQKESAFDALLQLCLLNGLIWVLLILLQVTKEELFYYNRDVKAVVFETRSPTEAFTVATHRFRESFTQTEARLMRYDVQRHEGVYRRRTRRLRRRLTCLREKLAYSYGELAQSVGKNRQRLSEERTMLVPLEALLDRLQRETTRLAECLCEEEDRHTEITARYEKCLKAVTGSIHCNEENTDMIGSGDFLPKDTVPYVKKTSPEKQQQHSGCTEDEWI